MLHARAHIKITFVIERPSAMRTLYPAQIAAIFCSRIASSRFRRDSGVTKHIPTEWSRLLQAGRTQCPSSCRHSSSARVAVSTASQRLRRPRTFVSSTNDDLNNGLTRSAARWPNGALSIVAGKPMAVQSPAKNRLSQAVSANGRSAFCSGVAANVARDRDNMPRRQLTESRPILATSRHMACANSSRGIETMRRAWLDCYRDSTGPAKIHWQVPLMTPTSTA